MPKCTEISTTRSPTHQILDALLDFAERDHLGAVEEHGHNGVHTAEHLRQQLVLAGQGKARGKVLGEGVIALERWSLLAAEVSKRSGLFTGKKHSCKAWKDTCSGTRLVPPFLGCVKPFMYRFLYIAVYWHIVRKELLG